MTCKSVTSPSEQGRCYRRKVNMNNSNHLENCPFCGRKISVFTCDRIITFTCEPCGYSRSFKGLITTVPHRVRINDSEYYNPKAYEEAEAEWNKRVLPIRAEWFYDSYLRPECSNCNYKNDKANETTPYCPSCGAKMKEFVICKDDDRPKLYAVEKTGSTLNIVKSGFYTHSDAMRWLKNHKSDSKYSGLRLSVHNKEEIYNE